MNVNRIAIKTTRLITPLQEISDAVVIMEGGKIAAVGKQSTTIVPEDCQVIDVQDKIVAPGFIDIHIHGGLGLLSVNGQQAVQKISAHLVKAGCTSWLPTVNTLESLPEVLAAKKNITCGSDIVGIHMEGPFLTPKGISGIQGIDMGLEKPSVERLHQFVEAAEGELKLMGVGIELDGALDVIRELSNLGIVASAAHTKATYEQFLRSVEVGVRHVTHTFNVMTGLHHRKPGVVGGALTCDQVTGELIADGFHVSPVAMDVMIRCKGTDKVCLISDNTAIAGLPDGVHELNGRKIIKENGVSRFAGSNPEMDNTMAGSEWPINHNVGNLVRSVGVKLKDALKMASLVPARVIKVDGFKGSIEPGKDADLIVIDENVNVFLTIVKGTVCYNRLGQ